ncbi:MAG TPA: S1-like domain-containing RNA-binding protein, partial [Bacteroidales bacterium]|nr:S1-like domain-containing RNA-binding protein [Bacteroidales bacterium]
MIEPGLHHTLQVVRTSEQGVYLTRDEEEAILLPNRYIPTGLQMEDEIEVFVYTDSQGRLIATTLQPKITLHRFSFLEVTSVTQYGAFVDWGIAKELLVPFREQDKRLEAGQHTVVYLYKDEASGRLAGSAKVRKFLDNHQVAVDTEEEVQILIYDQTELGYKAIVNDRHEGLIYSNEIYQSVGIGQRLKAYVKKVREDGKLDLDLQPPGYSKVAPNAERILNVLKDHDGWLPLTDKSSPQAIS